MPVKGWIWASGDRVNLWSKRYEKKYPDGTVHVVTVDKVRVRYPSRQQLTKVGRHGIVTIGVVPATRKIVDATGRPVFRTTYYLLMESFHGGPGSKGDPLGGFASGGAVDLFEESYKKQMAKLHRAGFRLKS